jgi:hydrogenase maturation protease
MSLVVFAVGNESRGDDALGPLLLGRLEGLALPGVTTIFDFQLQIEHALDLQGHDLALFIDAGQGTPAPFSFAPVLPAADNSHTSHALSPAAVLDVYRRAVGGEPPPAFILGVRGESFELGDGLSPAAIAHLEQAWHFLQGLCAGPELVRWQRTELTAA